MCENLHADVGKGLLLKTIGEDYEKETANEGVNYSCGIFNVILIRVLNEFTYWQRKEQLTKVCMRGRERERKSDK